MFDYGRATGFSYNRGTPPRATVLCAAGTCLGLLLVMCMPSIASTCTGDVNSWEGVRDCFKQVEVIQQHNKLMALTATSIVGWLVVLAIVAFCSKDGLHATWAAFIAWVTSFKSRCSAKPAAACYRCCCCRYCCRVHPTKSQPPPPPLPPRAATTNTDAVKAEPPDGDSGGEQQQANPSSTSKAAELSLMPAMPGEPLGYSNTRVGQLVVRGPDWAAADGDDDGGAGRIGVVMCVTPAAMAAASPALRNGAPNSACPQPQSQSPQQQPASGGAQVVTVRWCKTGLETTANVRGGTAGSRKFCVAVMEVDVVLLADDGA